MKENSYTLGVIALAVGIFMIVMQGVTMIAYGVYTPVPSVMAIVFVFLGSIYILVVIKRKENMKKQSTDIVKGPIR